MSLKSVLILSAAAAALSGCGRLGDSSWSPTSWLSDAPDEQGTLEPTEGYTTADETRILIAHVGSAKMEPLTEGRLLVVTGIGPTKGWWDAALVSDTRGPRDVIAPDPDGVLRLRFVANPPLAGTAESRIPANPDVDTLTVGLALSHRMLSRTQQIIITGAGNSISLRP